MRWRLALAAAAAMLLSSCWWVGPQLYTGDPADAGPVRPGVYKVDALGDGKPGRPYRITWESDGSVLSTPLKPKKDEGPVRYVATRFAVPGRDLWIVQTIGGEKEGEVAYGLAELRGDILSASPVIDCESTAQIVRAAGGEYDEGVEPVGNIEDAEPATTNEMQPDDKTMTAGRIGGPSCRFRDRASLERALRAYVATGEPLLLRLRLKRIGD